MKHVGRRFYNFSVFKLAEIRVRNGFVCCLLNFPQSHLLCAPYGGKIFTQWQGG